MPSIREQIEALPIAEDAKGVIHEVIKRKGKVDGLKRMQILLAIINSGVAIIILVWLYKLSLVSNVNVFELISYLGSSTASTFFLLVAISSFIYSGHVTKEHKKEKQKYDDLRREAITYLRARWDIGEGSLLRDRISSILDQGGINLIFYS
ncbi:hypothetical protein FHS18_002053 [Paenibacillus phyllosphaerae]|uniref:DUF2663 family protein n=1 Tax=Paenibacillus phyllosphaerae TaxID=274593 RepID=A0A7W5FM73_9BACL|nr:DUF2663 family protein [Paenibacillus phyllosphaerae]MBB3109990.1 hypothetical protein [Paenibacillus phyllosphaerae]